MTQKLLLYFFLLSISNTLFSQSISGKVLSKITKLPIENVSILSDINTGTTTDIDGKFTISIHKINSLKFSYLGFETQTISLEHLKKSNFIVDLTEIYNQLDEIKITTQSFSLDSLLKKTNILMNKKYYDTIVQQNLFLEKTNHFMFNNLNVSLKSKKNNAIVDQNKLQNELNIFTENIIKNSLEDKIEYSGIFTSKKIYLKHNKDIYHIVDSEKIEGYAANEKNSTINLQNQLQEIILRNLNQKKSFKVKSGFFKVEDSLSLNEKSFLNDSLKNVSFRKFEIEMFKNTIEKMGTFFRKSDENNFLNTTFYQHKLENTLFFNNQKMFLISFYPRKSKAKYQGKIYINADDFTISKINVGFADGKRGANLNLKLLLGIKFEENIHDISIHYQKMDNGNIYTSYIKEKKSRNMYANRPFKFVENSKDKNKLKFDFKAVFVNTESFEIVLDKPIILSKMTVKRKNKEFFKERIPFLTKNEYSKTTWKNRKQIEAYLISNQ